MHVANANLCPINSLSTYPRSHVSSSPKSHMISYQKGMHKSFLKTLNDLILKFQIQEATGLNLSDAVVLLQDLIDLQAINSIERGKFLETKKRALFLPHCSRKYMDSRCKATFNPDIPSIRVHIARRTVW